MRCGLARGDEARLDERLRRVPMGVESRLHLKPGNSTLSYGEEGGAVKLGAHPKGGGTCSQRCRQLGASPKPMDSIMTHPRLALAALLCAVAPATFANTAQINLTGTITPAACKITLANGGNFDRGQINAADLNSDAMTTLPSMSTDFSIDCDAAMPFAISAVDLNEADNAEANQYRLSLGTTAAGEHIGFFGIVVDSPKFGAAPLFGTMSADGGNSWTASAVGGMVSRNGGLLGWGLVQGDTGGPAAIQQISGQLRVTSYINPTSSLTLLEDQSISGSVVLTLEYL